VVSRKPIMSEDEWQRSLLTVTWNCSQCGSVHHGLTEKEKGRLTGFCPKKLKMVLAYIWTSNGWHNCADGDIILEED